MSHLRNFGTLSGIFLFLAAFVFVAWPQRPVSAEELVWESDYRVALERAAAKRIPVLAYLYTDWCGFCRRIENTTFVDPELIRRIGPEFVWLRLNAETDPQGSQLRERFQVSGYPTILILDEEGSEIDRLRGYQDSAAFEKNLKESLEGPSSFLTIRGRARDNPDSPEAAYDLGVRLLERSDFEKAAFQFRRILELDPENARDRTDAAHFYLAVTLASQGRYPEALALLDKLQSRFVTSQFLVNSEVLRGQIYLFTGRMAEGQAVLSNFLKSHPDHPYASQVRMLVQGLDPSK